MNVNETTIVSNSNDQQKITINEIEIDDYIDLGQVTTTRKKN